MELLHCFCFNPRQCLTTLFGHRLCYKREHTCTLQKNITFHLKIDKLFTFHVSCIELTCIKIKTINGRNYRHHKTKKTGLRSENCEKRCVIYFNVARKYILILLWRLLI